VTLFSWFVWAPDHWLVYVERSGTHWLRESVILAVGCLWLAACVSVAASDAPVRRRWLAVCGFAVAVGIGVAFGRIEMLQSLWGRNDEHRAFAVLAAAAATGVGLVRGAGWLGYAVAPWLWQVAGWLVVGTLVTLAGAWLQLTAVLWLLLLASAIGARIVERPHRTVPFVVCVAVGFCVMSLATLGLGMVGLVSPWGLTTALVVASLALHRSLGGKARQCIAAIANVTPPTTWLSAAMRAAVVALFAVYFVAALGPETGTDALGFRLAAPVHWSASGSITALPQMISSYGVFAAETLDLLGLPLAGSCIVRLLQWACAVLLLVSAVRDVLGRCAGESVHLWLYPFFASTLVWWQFASGFNDTVQLLFAHSALLCLLRWREHPNVAWLFLLGACCGGAAATKVNGALCLVLVLVLLVFAGWSRGLRHCCLAAAKVGVGFAAIFAPWSLRALWLTGNPVFPFANGVFGSALTLTKTSEVAYGLGTSPTDLAKLPFALFVEPQRFGELGTLHPSLMLLMPFAVLGIIFGGGRGRFWAVAALVAFGLWALSLQNLRYGLLFVWCAALAMSLGLDATANRLQQRGRRWLVIAAVLLVFAGGVLQHLRPVAWMWARNDAAPLPTSVVFGTESEADYLTKHVRSYPAAQFLNERTDQGTRVWQLPRHLSDHTYFRAPVTAHPHGVQPLLAPMRTLLFDREVREDLPEIHARLVQMGYSHVMYWAPALTDKGVYSEAFADRYLTLVHAHNDVRLFEVLAQPREDVTGRAELVATLANDGTALLAAPDALYLLRMKLPEGVAGTRKVGVRWLGGPADGGERELLLSNLVEVGVDGRDFYQTAPAGTQGVALLLRHGFEPGLQVELRRIRTRP